jgi:hypothetical protein
MDIISYENISSDNIDCTAIVKETDDFAFLNPSCIMLPIELCIMPHRKATVLSAESPHHVPGLTVDFEQCMIVTRRDEIVAIAVLVDRVDVEEVPGWRSRIISIKARGLEV